MKFEVITGKIVAQLIEQDYLAIEQLVGDAYLAHYHRQTINPDSYFLTFPEQPQNRIIALPAALAGKNAVSGIKWISSYPENIKQNIPRASSVLILNDFKTGYPLACMEASIISASRTAASAVLAAYKLNNDSRRSGKIGFVGAGLIANRILKTFLNTGWNFSEIAVYDQSVVYANEFVESNNAIPIQVCDSLEELITSSDVIVLATTAPKPYIHDVELLKHHPIVLNISLRDLSEDIILSSHNIVDDIGHCLKANTSPHLASIKAGNHKFIDTTLPEILAGAKIPEKDKPIIFSPFGMGILDLALGNYLYQKSAGNGSSIVIDEFYHQTSRYQN